MPGLATRSACRNKARGTGSTPSGRNRPLATNADVESLSSRFTAHFTAPPKQRTPPLPHLSKADRAAMLGELYLWLGSSRRILAKLAYEAENWQDKKIDRRSEHAHENLRSKVIAKAIAAADNTVEDWFAKASRMAPKGTKGESVRSAPPWKVWDRLVGVDHRWLLLPNPEEKKEEFRRSKLQLCVPPIARWLGRLEVRSLASSIQRWARSGESIQPGPAYNIALDAHLARGAVHADVTNLGSAKGEANLRECFQLVTEHLSGEPARKRTGELTRHELRRVMANLLAIDGTRIGRLLTRDD